MNMDELIAFQQVVRLQSISKAAETLYLTQPTLSKRIKQLEIELGYPLLIRKKGVHKLELTDQGKAFYEIAQNWQKMYEESLGIRNLCANESLTFSAINSIATSLAPIVCSKFIKQYPHVNITFFQNSSPEIYNKLEQFQLDLGIVAESKYSKKIQTFPLMSEEFCIIAPLNFSDQNTLYISNLDVRNEVRIPWNAEFTKWHDHWFGTPLIPKVQTTTVDLSALLLTEHGGWVVVPITNALLLTKNNPSLRIYEIDNPPPNRLLYLVRRSDQSKEVVSSFIECIVDCIKSDFPFQTFSKLCFSNKQ
jgi:DNA-binding transcriptional LysR family regulator